MSFSDYLYQLEYTDFNRDVTDLHQSSFLMLGDEEPYNAQDIFRDGVIYNVHKFILKSPVDQSV